MAGGTRLELEERERLAALKAEGLSLRAIARQLGRAASTVSRELRRNALPKGGYLPVHAEGCYLERRQRPAVLERDERLGRFVRERLLEGWTPEQIAGWLRPGRGGGAPPRGRLVEGWAPEQIAGWLERGEERGLRPVSLETIYAFIHRPGQKGEKLWKLLPRGRARRGRRRARPPRSTIAGRRSIHDRPADVQERKDPGHWEGDLPPDPAGAGARGAQDPLRARGPAGRQVRGGDRGGADGGVPAARPAPAVLDHLRQRHGVRPARPARQRLRDDDLVLRRLRLLAEGGRGERERAAAPRPAARPRPGRPDRRRAAGDRAQPRPDAAEVPRPPDAPPDAPPGAAQGAWQGRPNPLRLTRCASPVNPPMY